MKLTAAPPRPADGSPKPWSTSSLFATRFPPALAATVPSCIWVMARAVAASRLDVARQAEGFRYCMYPWGPNLLGASCSSRFRLRDLEAHLALLMLVAIERRYYIGVCFDTTCNLGRRNTLTSVSGSMKQRPKQFPGRPFSS
jgi:hypothetical protein